ncbi:MAG: prolyl oligopeptidase family serine peptidase [Gemmatimonadaceae bacterium]
MRLHVRAPILAALLLAPLALPAQTRGLRAEDVYRLQDVRDPQRSPDGRWVAYAVSSADSAKDKNDSDVWMVSWDGRDRIRVTSSPEGEGTPRWSPDGRYLAFLSGRQASEGGEGAQVWLLDRRGGEAQRLTSVKGGVSSYAWSPDGSRLVLVVDEEDDSTGKAKTDSTKPKTAKPIVLDRYRFKRDVAGYLGATRSHLYLFDVAAKKGEHFAGGLFDYESPAWSPDGKSIAFVSKQGTVDVDRNDNSDVWVVEARAGATARRLTTFAGSDEGSLSWSPDGRYIAYLQGIDPKYGAYDLSRLAVVPAAGGPARMLTEALDRPVASPAFQPDGSILFLVTDDRSRHLYRVRPAGAGSWGAPQRVLDGKHVINGFSAGKDGGVALLAATASEPAEIAALDANGRQMRELAAHNEWLKDVRLSTVEEVSFRSKDGTEIHGLLHRPFGATAGARLPTLLRIHGGPYSQDQHEFMFERELFAANGYAVLAVNYRGSNGRGEKFGTAIFGDWGNLEVQDLLAGVDHVIQMGVADPDRLGLGGWSYGGILTDYTIAQTNRFKAATSGAGSALQLSMYGTDQYIVQYEAEIGPPWKAQEQWLKISYPFFHADRITTPTLFMVGEKDFNVPAAGSEQMYQALRSLGVPTQLVIYPGQFHGITVPSYKVDRLKRYLAWYDRYLLKGGKAAN